jgi:hypothetical protein
MRFASLSLTKRYAFVAVTSNTHHCLRFEDPSRTGRSGSQSVGHEFAVASDREAEEETPQELFRVALGGARTSAAASRQAQRDSG